VYLLLAALIALGALVTSAAAAPSSPLERLLPPSVDGYTLFHFDHQDAIRPRAACPGGHPLSACALRDAQTAGSHPRADRPRIMVRVMRPPAPLTESDLRRALGEVIGMPAARRVGERRVFSRTALGASYAAALIDPRTVAVAVAEGHGRSAAGPRLAREAIRATLAREPVDPGPRTRVRVPGAQRAPAERPERSRRLSHDRCSVSGGPGQIPVCPDVPTYIYRGLNDEQLERSCAGTRVVSLYCPDSDNLCGPPQEVVYGAVFIDLATRWSGYLSCGATVTLGWGQTKGVSASCDKVERVLGTIARPLVDTTAVGPAPSWSTSFASPRRYYGRGSWAKSDQAGAIGWDYGVYDDGDTYTFHNWDATSASRDVRMFVACANP
jgi:hypothetical protein